MSHFFSIDTASLTAHGGGLWTFAMFIVSPSESLLHCHLPSQSHFPMRLRPELSRSGSLSLVWDTGSDKPVRVCPRLHFWPPSKSPTPFPLIFILYTPLGWADTHRAPQSMVPHNYQLALSLCLPMPQTWPLGESKGDLPSDLLMPGQPPLQGLFTKSPRNCWKKKKRWET